MKCNGILWGIYEQDAAFNKRDIDGALALMKQDVSWPKASEGGKVDGKEEIRAYWTRQWGEFDPHVEPLAITEGDGGTVRVRVRSCAGLFHRAPYAGRSCA
jgi:ketosteroid isomerase-like protein